MIRLEKVVKNWKMTIKRKENAVKHYRAKLKYWRERTGILQTRKNTK